MKQSSNLTIEQSNNETLEPQHFESLYPPTSRFAQISLLLQYIKEGKSSQIIALPGAGGSTLLGLLAYNKALRQTHLHEDEKWLHFVPVDFLEIRNKTLSDCYKLLLLQLIDSLQKRTLSEEATVVKTVLQDALSFQDELILFQAMKKAIEYLSLEKKLTIVFLFDHFDEYIPMLTTDFFANLKTLRNLAKYRFSVVFSLNRPLEQLIEESLFHDFAEFVSPHTIYLPLLDEPSLSFRLSYTEKVSGKTLDEQTKQALLRDTSGHAKLTRLTCELALHNDVILNLFQDLTIPDQVRSDKLLDERQIWHALNDIWQSFSPAEKSHFLKDLFEKQYHDEHTSYLEAIGLLKDEKPTMPLFTSFVQTQKETQEAKNVHFQFIPETNTIHQGETDITSSFTAIEFRLLRFFLQNSGKILERNTIISGVWNENKSVMGVTDQALDQLIFRLRRKIEEDPNHPTHIQTIKGRGFTFTP